MSYRKPPSLFALALILGLTTPMPWTAAKLNDRVLAQSTPAATFPLPTSVPKDTKITIDGSTSMKTINQTFGDDFEKTYPGTAVTADYGGTEAALKEVLEGKRDLAAVGRNLTEAEKAKGLIAVPIARRKIVMIVSPDNPFNGSLTIEQFAKIFRGEIKDWSAVGGQSGVVRFIDRPESSDTRAAFQNYPVFQNAPFKTGDTAVTVTEDTTEAVVEKLGKDGISYAIVDQVESNPSVKMLKMHENLPDNPKYPFSQALVYVYKGPEPNAAAKAFLGYATAPNKDAAIATASPTPDTTTQAPTTTTTTTTEERGGGLPGWLWWLIPLALLAALPFLLKGRNEEAVEESVVRPMPVVPPVVPPVVAEKTSRIILTPRNCREAYAYWEATDEAKAVLRRQGGEKLALRIYDVTDIDLDKQPAHAMQQYDCRELDPDLHVPIPTDNRDYLAELGYVTPEGNWLWLARSEHVRVPACSPVVAENTSRLILVPRNCQEAYAYWEITDEEKAAPRGQGGEKLALRIYDVTDLDLEQQPAHALHQYDCPELDRDLHIPIPTDNRDYLAELGYVTSEGNWLRLARSESVHVPACGPGTEQLTTAKEALSDVGGNLTGGATSILAGATVLATGAAVAAHSWMTGERETVETRESVTPSEGTLGERIIYVPRNSQEAYVYWEVSADAKEAIRQQGGRKLALRIYDLTDINADGTPDSIWQYDVEEIEPDKHVPIHRHDRDYVAELGYLTEENLWLAIARSQAVYVPIPPEPTAQ